MIFKNSPIQKIKFNSYEYYIKRDDLLHKDFSGNKARKFFYFLKKDFPKIEKIVSFGSSQSNAMYSLSVLAKLKNWDFDYYVNHISKYLKVNPNGNYKYALENGMKIYEKSIPLNFDEKTLFINEGAAVKEASFGIKILAEEINFWAEQNDILNLKIFLPSGTGTTSLYLQKYLDFEVLTCPCVGDEEYLKKQFNLLEQKNHPRILKAEKKYHFGKLYKEFFDIHEALLKQTNIEFDLLYDSLGWLVFEQYLKKNLDKEFKYLYIHQGGILGNESMYERYKYKYNKTLY